MNTVSNTNNASHSSYGTGMTEEEHDDIDDMEYLIQVSNVKKNCKKIGDNIYSKKGGYEDNPYE